MKEPYKDYRSCAWLFSRLMICNCSFIGYPELKQALKRDIKCPRVRIFALGKGAWQMAAVCSGQLEKMGISSSGIIYTTRGNARPPDILKECDTSFLARFSLFEGSHPLPSMENFIISRQILDWLQSLEASETLIILISGGASALLEIPAAGKSDEDIIRLNQKLLASGKDISQINAQRIQYSAVKGGKALSFLSCGAIFSYAVSDVENDPPWLIGSGPFFPLAHARPSYTNRLGHNRYDITTPHQKLRYRIIANNRSFLMQLIRNLQFVSSFAENTQIELLPNFQNLEAEQLAEYLHKQAILLSRRRGSEPRSLLLIAGGESRVQVKGKGRGGRCLHLALKVSMLIRQFSRGCFIAYATDGSDAESGSSGAMIDQNTYSQLKEGGMDPEQYLSSCDSLSALEKVHATLGSVYTGTNVNEIYLYYLTF
ncbi:MAG: DUF4147 domain-containing protein [Candidatus Cloacimonetes bacterium]|nr:DUF4147 domain-containing protein [Candidatus Cloacimonadota bacterium]